MFLIYKTKKANINDLQILVALSYNMTKDERYERDDLVDIIKNDIIEILYLNDIAIGYYTVINHEKGKYLETILIDKKYQGTEAVYELCNKAVSPVNGNPLWGLSKYKRVDMLLKKFGFEPKEYETIKGVKYRWWINRFQSQ